MGGALNATYPISYKRQEKCRNGVLQVSCPARCCSGKLTAMTSTHLQTLSAYSTAFAAFGTVGALAIGLITYRTNFNHRRHSEVRGVRAWVKWSESESYQTAVKDYERKRKSKKFTTATLVDPTKYLCSRLTVENATEDLIYDVLINLILPKKYGTSVTLIGHMQPGEKQELPSQLNVEERDLRYNLYSTTGADIVFTDSRGVRWSRSSKGILKIIHPLKWYIPWRVPHEHDLPENVSIWFLRARWKYRSAEYGNRLTFGYPPQFWAFDIRWRRWRFSKKESPYEIPAWNLFKKWKSRHGLFIQRKRARLCTPWFAIDDNLNYWVAYRGEIRERRQRTEAWEKNFPMGEK